MTSKHGDEQEGEGLKRYTINPRTEKPAGMLADLMSSVGAVASIVGLAVTFVSLTAFFVILRSDVNENSLAIRMLVEAQNNASAAQATDRLANAELRGTVETFIRLLQQRAELPYLHSYPGSEFPDESSGSGRIPSSAD